MSYSENTAKPNGSQRRIYRAQRALAHKAWLIFGAAPLWLKIMGIVVIPLVCLMLAVSAASNLLDASLLSWQTAGVFSVALIVGIVSALILSHILVNPLTQIVKLINRLEQADFSARIPVWAHDEIGSIQHAFNMMAANLQVSHETLVRRNHELRALNTLAETMVIDQGEEALLETALTSALTLIRADGGVVWLVGDTGGGVEFRIERGTVVPDIDHIIRGSGEHQIYKHALMDWICVPLRIQRRVVGGIALGRQSADMFHEEEITLLEALGNVTGNCVANAHLLADIQRKEIEVRRTLKRALEAQEAERKRVSRELHDEVGQALTSILLRLKALQDETDPEVISARLNGLRYLTGETLEEVRRLSMDLRPAVLDSLGLVPAIRWHVQQCRERSGLMIALKVDETLPRLTPEVEIVLYRAVQEGLTNVIRHASAHGVEIELMQHHEMIILTIADDGKGIESEHQNEGLGLSGMRERVALVDGNLHIESTAGKGTRIKIELQVDRGQADDNTNQGAAGG